MICHWDEVEPFEVQLEQLRGRRRRLAPAAGAPRLGLSRYEMGPGERAVPLHVHADEEEFFVVLRGSGLAIENDHAHAISAGDVLFYAAGDVAHTMVAGDDGLDVLAFGSGSDTHLVHLPRAGAMWLGTRWLPLDGPNPFKLEDAVGPLAIPEPGPRSSSTLAIDDVPARPRRRGDVGQQARYIGLALGARRSGLSETTVDAGMRSNPPHCHSSEDELFVVVGGDGQLELLHPNGSDESYPVRVGSVISRPAGTGIAHSFVAGPEGLALLGHSTLDPGDIVFFPRSQKIIIRGLRTIMRIEAVDFWDGEE
ncbi:unannotated protein [freshwater metagenome]|uniref:Unannotated protein n=1 Tax=freshwater metagenome TaxID=449393 RepID=A0A6J7IWG3_9ZZZZ|nr:cupin domain-containing protein [Actinomycetota bacterium]